MCNSEKLIEQPKHFKYVLPGADETPGFALDINEVFNIFAHMCWKYEICYDGDHCVAFYKDGMFTTRLERAFAFESHCINDLLKTIVTIAGDAKYAPIFSCPKDQIPNFEYKRVHDLVNLASKKFKPYHEQPYDFALQLIQHPLIRATERIDWNLKREAIRTEPFLFENVFIDVPSLRGLVTDPIRLLNTDKPELVHEFNRLCDVVGFIYRDLTINPKPVKLIEFPISEKLKSLLSNIPYENDGKAIKAAIDEVLSEIQLPEGLFALVTCGEETPDPDKYSDHEVYRYPMHLGLVTMLDEYFHDSDENTDYTGSICIIPC